MTKADDEIKPTMPYRLLRTQALQLYLSSNLGLRGVAKEIGVSRSCCENWSRLDGWVQQRQKILSDRLRLIHKEIADKNQTEASSIVANLFELFRVGCTQRMGYLSGVVPKRGLFSVEELCILAEACVRTGSMEDKLRSSTIIG